MDRIIQGSDELLNPRSYAYDANGNLQSATLVVGGETLDQVSYTYDLSDRRSTMTASGGLVTRYAYDAAGNVVAVTDPDGYVLGFAYDPSNRVVLAVDQEGNTVVRELDVDGKPRAVTDPNGNTVTFEYWEASRQGRLKAQYDATGRKTSFDYDLNGNVVAVTDNLGRVTLTTYDALNRPTRVVGPVYPDATYGQIRPVTVYTYDLLGNLTRVDAGRTEASGTIPGSDVVSVQMATTWDDFGRKLRATDALSRTWQWTYDVHGNVLTAVDGQGQVTRANWGPGRQLLSQGDGVTGGPGPLLAVTQSSRTYSGAAPPPAGYGYFYRGAICVASGSDSCVGGEPTTRSGLGPVIGYVKTSGGAGTVPLYRNTCYGEAGVCDGASASWGLGLTANGSVVGYLSTGAPDGASEANPFVLAGGLVLQGVTGPAAGYLWTAGTTTHTDFVYTVEATPPTGYTPDGTTAFLHPGAGAGRVAVGRYTNASTGQHYYTAASDPPAGFVVEGTLGYVETSGAGGGTGFWRHVNGATGDYAVTTLGTPPSGYQAQALLGYVHTGHVTDYTRNALGQVTKAASAEVTYTYTYDAAHRLATVTDSRGAKRLTYAWSPGGRLNALTASDGQETTYRYDGVGRLTGLWAPTGDLVAYGYDGGGRLVQKWLPNGVTTEYGWERDNRLRQLVNRHGAGPIISQHDYTYDGVGNRQTHTELIGGTTTPYRYGYDPLDRLVEVRDNATSALLEGYAYDPLGNRLTKTAGGVTTHYGYDGANQLVEVRQGSLTGVPNLTYDLNGSLTQKAMAGTTTVLTYDPLNRVAQVTVTGQPTESYTYDGEGRRIRTVVGSVAKNFLYAGPDIVGQYADGWGPPAAVVTHGPSLDDPLSWQTGATVQYFHADGLGSVVAVTNPSGATEGTARYDAWGTPIASSGSLPLYGYTGREPDDTGLIYYRARYYDPAIGRFVQRDPIGFAGGDINLYAYVGNNPVNLNDPTGEAAHVMIGAVAGGLLGGGSALMSGKSWWDVGKATLRGRKTINGRVIVGGPDGWCSSSRRETDGA